LNLFCLLVSACVYLTLFISPLFLSPLQRLIYAGQILKDHNTLASYNIKDGHALHMVKGASPAPGASATPAAAPAPAAATAGPAGVPPLGGLGGLFGNLGNMQGQSLPDMQAQVQQLMQNPEHLQQMMNSPL
jgi:ubiquilin